MDGFQRRREQKKNNILNAALALFKEYGVQKVSISEIATKANVSQVTIYNYFESKNNLIHEVFKYYVDQSWLEVVEILDSDMNYHDKIKQLIFNKKEAADNIHEDFYNYFMKEYSQGTNYIEEFYQERGIPRLMEFFNEGRAKGYVNQNVSNEAILFYMQMLREYMQKEDVYKQILPLTEDITNLLFYGIVGKKD
ncbi:TetR/AcrR family transcriptional regulator [Alkalibacillus aidingensis]|uniref:TetR/AcrR family transcriptional regulator n=1 Tax=Alkalibacillus aidingensis TaxID=2747607 RepID=UPI0016605CCB|nr:TetR/AcrR family transcriptional regulator [Alkalibacillus aidingensis]